MRLQLTLVLISLLFPEALGTRCYECLSVVGGPCNETQKDCPAQCASSTIGSYLAGQQQNMEFKSCAAPRDCFSGSMNTGYMKMTFNTKCCSTDLCNNQKVPALSRGSPNGKKCYTCLGDDCSGTVNCEGDENHCINIQVNAAGVKATRKGCATKSVCCADPASIQIPGVSGGVTCCQGDLCNGAEVGEPCNGAEGVNLSILLILGPLLSSILFL